MKYTIKRIFSFKHQQFEIICNSKIFSTVKTKSSKEYQGRYNVKLSKPINKSLGEDICIVESDPKQAGGYLIYLRNEKLGKKMLFGKFSYQLCGRSNYLYTIIIGQKLYQVRSSDLEDRRLTIIDHIQSTNSSGLDCPETLFQVNDSFSRSNKEYHVTINDPKSQYGYLALVILLNLHEYKRVRF